MKLLARSGGTATQVEATRATGLGNIVAAATKSLASRGFITKVWTQSRQAYLTRLPLGQAWVEWAGGQVNNKYSNIPAVIVIHHDRKVIEQVSADERHRPVATVGDVL